jgi:HK97 family phage portal protein
MNEFLCIKISGDETLLKEPVFGVSWSSFLSNIIREIYIFGNCFLINHNDKLKFLSQNLVRIQRNNNDEIAAYIYTDGKREVRFLPQEVLHLSFFSGVSPLKAALKSIELMNSIGEFVAGMVQNGGRPTGMVTFENVRNEQDIQDQLRKLYQHMNKQGALAIFTGEKCKWERIGLTLEEMKLLPYAEYAEKKICLVFNLPPLLVGLEQATYANFSSARQQLREDTIYPQMRYLLEMINMFKKSSLNIVSVELEKKN